MSKGTAVFIDTSIVIAQLVHSPETKQRIKARLQRYNLVTTSLVVRQEFKRRLLKEANYLLSLFARYGSFKEVNRHIIDKLGGHPGNKRKRNINLDLLATIDERDTDEDRAERARLFLRDLVLNGLDSLESRIDHIYTASGCACGRMGVKEISKGKRTKYEFGTDDCKKMPSCSIASFLSDREGDLERVRQHLYSLPADAPESTEIKAIARFVSTLDKQTVKSRNPCKTVGDLLIALESHEVPDFYTLNGKESQHLAKPLGQTLVVCPVNPDREEVVCRAELQEWPFFPPKKKGKSGDHA